MLDWIRTALGGWGAIADEIKQMLLSVFGGLVGWIQGVFSEDKRAWNSLWAALNGQAGDLDYFGNRVWLNLNWTGRAEFPALRRYVDAFNARQDAWNARWHALLWKRDEDNHAFTVSEVDGAKAWALLIIFWPLMKLATILGQEMLKWAYWAFKLLTDLPRLAGLLLWPLTAVFEATWWTWSRTVGDWVGKLIIHNLLKSITLAEQILADIL